MVLTLEQALADAQDALTHTEEKIARLSERVAELREEKRGLELALARHGGSPRPADLDRQTVNEWTDMQRTNAIERMLAEARGPLSPSVLSERLMSLGRPGDTQHAVSAALAHLSRKGRVYSPARGQWALVTGDAEAVASEEADPVPTESATVEEAPQPQLEEAPEPQLPSPNGAGTYDHSAQEWSPSREVSTS